MVDSFTHISLISVNYNRKKLLKPCLDSMFGLNYPKSKLEVIVVDNGSTDGSVEFINKHYPKVKLLQNDVNNYCRANNLGIKQAKGRYIGLINNDVKLDKDWLTELLEVAKSNHRIGAVTSKILFPDKRINSTGHVELPNLYWADRGFKEKDRGQYNRIEEIESLSHCACLYNKDCLKDIGLLDEDFNMYLEDVDMSIRAKKKGWRLFYVPEAICYHRFHGTANEELVNLSCERSRLLLIAKHFPEKLSWSLYGKGYFTVINEFDQRKDIYDVLPDVFTKLFKHHRIEMVSGLFSGIFENLRGILMLEKQHLIQCLDSEKNSVKQKDEQLQKIFQEAQSRLEEIRQKDNEIKQREIIVKEMEIRIRERDSQLLDKDKLLCEKDKHLYELDSKLHALIQESQQRQEEIRQRDNLIEGIAKDRDIRIKEKEQAINERDRKITDLYYELSQLYESETYRFLAIPIWKVLDVIKGILRLFGFHPRSISAQCLLVIKPSCVTVEEVESALQKIRFDNSKVRITLLADLSEAEFNRFTQSNYIEEKKSYLCDGKRISKLELLKMLMKLRIRGFDEAIVIVGKPTFHGYRKAKLFAILCNARKTEVYYTDAKVKTPLKSFGTDIQYGISNQVSFGTRGILYSIWSSFLLWLIVGSFLTFIILPMRIKKFFQR